MRIYIQYTSFFLLLLMLCGLCTHTKAQPVEFGISRGINISTHTGKFEYREEGNQIFLTPNLTTDLHMGLMARKKISSTRLQFESSINVLGAQYDDSFTLQGEEFHTKSKTQLTYLQLPILLQFPIATSDKRFLGLPSSTIYHLTGGIYGEFLLDAQYEGINKRQAMDSSEAESFSKDVILRYSRYDAGAIFGAGIESGTNINIGFETRLQYTIIQTFKNKPRYKTRNIALTFTLYLLL